MQWGSAAGNAGSRMQLMTKKSHMVHRARTECQTSCGWSSQCTVGMVTRTWVQAHKTYTMCYTLCIKLCTRNNVWVSSLTSSTSHITATFLCMMAIKVYRYIGACTGRQELRSQRTLLLTCSMQYVAILGMLVTLSPSAVRFECILHVHHEA